MIVIAGLLKFNPEDRDEVLERLREVTRRSRLDPGCIDYWWAEDVETASAFRFLECWETQELMDGHMAQPYVDDFMKQCVSRVVDVHAHSYQVTDRQSAVG